MINYFLLLKNKRILIVLAVLGAIFSGNFFKRYLALICTGN